MPDIKPVIVATDGSDHSLRVLPHAMRLAEAIGSEIELLRVIEGDEVSAEPGETRDAAVARTKAAIEAALANDLAHFGAQGSVSVVLTPETKPAAALLSAAERCQVIAMHSRGRGGLARMLHGSVAIDVLKKVGFPVFLGGPNLLPPRSADGRYHLLITTDFSSDADRCLETLAPLIAQGSFDVTLLNVHLHAPGGVDNAAQIASHEAQIAQKRTLLPDSVKVDTVVRDIPIGAGIDTAIMETAEKVGANAIAIATHGASARHHLIMGSVAMSILSRSPLPLIAVRAHAGE